MSTANEPPAGVVGGALSEGDDRGEEREMRALRRWSKIKRRKWVSDRA